MVSSLRSNAKIVARVNISTGAYTYRRAGLGSRFVGICPICGDSKTFINRLPTVASVGMVLPRGINLYP